MKATSLPDLSKPKWINKKTKENQCFHFFLKQLAFLRFLKALKGLQRSGRLVGSISTYPGTNKSPWCRVMTKTVSDVLNVRFKKNVFPTVCLDPFRFRKVREAGSFHVSNFRQKRMAWCRVMTKKPKMCTTIQLTTNESLSAKPYAEIDVTCSWIVYNFVF